jgi:hypothetical protein
MDVIARRLDDWPGNMEEQPAGESGWVAYGGVYEASNGMCVSEAFPSEDDLQGAHLCMHVESCTDGFNPRRVGVRDSTVRGLCRRRASRSVEECSGISGQHSFAGGARGGQCPRHQHAKHTQGGRGQCTSRRQREKPRARRRRWCARATGRAASAGGGNGGQRGDFQGLAPRDMRSWSAAAGWTCAE